MPLTQQALKRFEEWQLQELESVRNIESPSLLQRTSQLVPDTVQQRTRRSTGRTESQSAALNNSRPHTPTHNVVRREPPETPEGKYWRTYVQTPVSRRLTSTTHRDEVLQALRDELHSRHRQECPFAPTLAMGTVAGRGSPAPFDASLSGGERSAADDEPPHYMLPLPVPPTPKAIRSPKITKKAKALVRGPEARSQWLEDKISKLCAAEDSNNVTEPTARLIDPNSERIVIGMSDRRIDVFSRAHMDAMASASEAKMRIARREAEQARDIRRSAPESKCVEKKREYPVLDSSWFKSMVQNTLGPVQLYIISQRTDHHVAIMCDSRVRLLTPI